MKVESNKTEADALDGVGNPAREGKGGPMCVTPNWLNYFDPDDLVIGAFRHFVTQPTINASCFASNLERAWPDLPISVQIKIRYDLERLFAESDDDQFGSKAWWHSGLEENLEEWELVREAWEEHDGK